MGARAVRSAHRRGRREARPLSISTNARRAGIVGAASVVLATACVVSLIAGGKETDAASVFAVLAGADDPYLRAVVDARIDRTVIGALVGAALAVSGVMIQGITRNPLGDPGLLGVTVGASAAVVTLTAFAGSVALSGTIWAAVVGAILTVVLVYVVGSRGSGIVSLLLTGAVVSAVLGAYVQAMTLSNPTVFDSFRFWVIGALNGRDLSVSFTILPFLVVGFALCMLLASGLNTLALGDEVAASLGTRVPLVRAGGILAAGILAAAATAAVGPISFVGLAVPHLVRSVIGTDHRWQIPAAAISGAALLIIADVIGRVIARPEDVMVGIVTAFVGAPFLLFAVRKGWAAR